MLVKTKTRKLDDANEVSKIYDDGTVKKSYHQDVADNIYQPDGTVLAIYRKKEVIAQNRLALCIKIANKIDKTGSFTIENGVPQLNDGSPRHSVAWLNWHGVTSVFGTPVKNGRK